MTGPRSKAGESYAGTPGAGENAKPTQAKISRSGYDVTPLSKSEVEKLSQKLNEQEKDILLRDCTEPAFTGGLVKNKDTGMYVCKLCGLPLYASDTKFESGTGWPSFFKPIDPDHVREVRDTSHGMVRTEIVCARCGGHLGHVFEDGPAPTGQRYCMNSAALDFVKEGKDMPEGSLPVDKKTAYFAGGCFWGIEDQFQQVPGVLDAVSGYQGGQTKDPSYKEVCTGTTGHAETVRVTYDANRVSYRELLEWFFKFHNPTQLNRQGPDVGEQYRSAIFTVDEDQARKARAYIEELSKSDRFKGKKIVTQVEPAGPFYEAEQYHQDYHAKHGGSCALPG
ncbi:MAG: bifunctional methionine sulfoxide reductase B/A protein [Phycisphaerae bacterium]|nr:bifunctional methionine sulfoxide reductase B/A protein [Phycisphaerae bacterium]